MVKITIISGTDRPDSNAIRVSRYLKKRYSRQGADVKIMDLKEFPLEAVKGGRYGKEIPEINDFIEPVFWADGLVLVVPEYNGGYPGILKLCIDYLPFPEAFTGVPLCFVGESAGAFGSMRAVEQMQLVAGYRHAYIYPERVFINRIKSNFDEEKGIYDDFQSKLLDSQIPGFIEFVKKMTK